MTVPETRTSATSVKRLPPTVAIKLEGEHTGRGFDILLRHGSVQMFPGNVFICRRELIEQALPELRDAGVSLTINRNLTRVTPADADALACRPGWEPLSG